jgi:glycosyltransferase involved in cell wall biosynthesis
MLDALGGQITAVGRPTEVIAVCDADVIEPQALETMLSRAMPRGVAAIVVPAPGTRYYEQKNIGAAAAKGDVVVFVDSDIALGPDWLAELLAPLDDPAVEVVCGTVYTEHDDFSGKVFALIWNFPPPPTAAEMELRRTVHFTANAVAFRTPTVRAHPFPDDARFRGQCHTLALDLERQGIDVWLNPRSVSVHPRPKGWRYVIDRAMCRGHDRMLTARLRERSTSFYASLRVLGSDLKRTVGRIRRGRRRVGLPAWQVPPAVLLAWWYCAWSFVGWQLAKVAPDMVRRRFRV